MHGVRKTLVVTLYQSPIDRYVIKITGNKLSGLPAPERKITGSTKQNYSFFNRLSYSTDGKLFSVREMPY